jgi:AcrR family transcriptional regulator
VPRWEPDALERLEGAALELFAEQGFERTTVAEIARSAGLTQRTFFNHFTDKREVLFRLSAGFQDSVVGEIDACADDVPPLDAVVGGLRAAGGSTFEQRRDAVVRRTAIVEANPDLRERDLAKRAALSDAIAAALSARGVAPETALLIAGTGMLVHQAAVRRWMQPAERRPLEALLNEALAALRATVGAAPDPAAPSGGD